MFLVLDTETTGLPLRKGFNKYYSPTLVNKYNNSRVIELAYIIIDEDYQIQKTNTTLIKPDGFTICNSEFHGITHDVATNEGIQIQDALDEFYRDIVKFNVHTIVGHNINFDKHILLSEMCRQQNIMSSTKYSLINKLNTKCTMFMGSQYYNLRKSPKLIDLYNKLILQNKPLTTYLPSYIKDHDPTIQHRALSDAMTCLVCFVLIQVLNYIFSCLN